MSTRECGPCTACCRRMAVPELQKPERVSCNHLTAKGCGIYTDPRKPAVCSSFKCGWLLGAFAPSDRPDLSGLIWTFQATSLGQVPVAFETRPEAREEARNAALIGRLSDEMIVLVRRYGDGTTIYGPSDLLEKFDLGKLGLGGM